MAISLVATYPSAHSSTFSTSPLVSPSFTPAAGEVLVVKVAGNATWTITGGGLTWTQRAAQTSSSSLTPVRIFTATVGSSPVAMTVTATRAGATEVGYMLLERWAGAKLAATPANASASRANSGGALSYTITTAAANSVVTWIDADWYENAVSGTYASGATQEDWYHFNGWYTVYAAWQSAAAAGAQTVGMTQPASQSYSSAAVEIQAVTQPTGGGGSLSIAATADPGFSPPRVRIDITDTRTPPATSVTINRTDATGTMYPVRTGDGNPVALSNGQATVYDYEAPYSQQLTYATDVAGAATVQAFLPVTVPWLVHIGVPSRSITFRMARSSGSLPAETWAMEQGVFNVLGRSTPVVVTGGARTAPASTLPVLCQTSADLAGLRQILSDGMPLLLNTPPGYGIDPAYIAAGGVTVNRLGGVVSDPYRSVDIAYQVVGRPGGGTQAALTWFDVSGKYATWQAIADAGITSWSQLASPTS